MEKNIRKGLFVLFLLYVDRGRLLIDSLHEGRGSRLKEGDVGDLIEGATRLPWDLLDIRFNRDFFLGFWVARSLPAVLGRADGSGALIVL